MKPSSIVKICVYCGELFERRPDEPLAAFKKRKKCKSTCISETDEATTVAGFRSNRAEDAGYSGIAECHMFTRSWFSQNRHWRKWY